MVFVWDFTKYMMVYVAIVLLCQNSTPVYTHKLQTLEIEFIMKPVNLLYAIHLIWHLLSEKVPSTGSQTLSV